MDPTRIRYADISKTFNCKLAKTVRTILRKEYNINKGIMCVFSEEIPQQPQLDTPENIIDHPADDYVKTFVIKNLQIKIDSLLKCVRT